MNSDDPSTEAVWSGSVTVRHAYRLLRMAIDPPTRSRNGLTKDVGWIIEGRPFPLVEIGHVRG